MRSTGAAYAEALQRMVSADAPDAVELAGILERLGRITGTVPVPRNRVVEPVPDWLADALLERTSLTRLEIAAMDATAAFDAWNSQPNRLTLPSRHLVRWAACTGSGPCPASPRCRCARCATTTRSACSTPAWVDPQSGYRWYTPEQLHRLHRILVLRDLGVSLAEIASLLDAEVTIEQLRGILLLREAEARERMEAESSGSLVSRRACATWRRRPWPSTRSS